MAMGRPILLTVSDNSGMAKMRMVQRRDVAEGMFLELR